MALPLNPPLKPMLAKAVSGIDQLPEGDLWFEPKWDGFRCIVFKDGDEIELGSRNERPLTRYFPELLDPLRAQLPERCVVDGEIVIVGPERLEFDQLQQRLHPAESRVNRLAAETPADFVAFDLLALGDKDLTGQPFFRRRAQLEEALTGVTAPLHLTRTTTDRDEAEDWFQRFEGAGLDGVMAKPADGLYVSDKRVQFKVKHQRTADCVVAGYRMHKSGDGVGSLLLGLWSGDGPDADLRHVGGEDVRAVRRAVHQPALQLLGRPRAAEVLAHAQHGDRRALHPVHRRSRRRRDVPEEAVLAHVLGVARRGGTA